MTAIKHTFLLFVCLFVTGTTIDTGCCEKTSTASCKFFLICLGHAVSIIIWSTTHAKGVLSDQWEKTAPLYVLIPSLGPTAKATVTVRKTFVMKSKVYRRHMSSLHRKDI
ncbi:uncharacterized protein LOC111099142 isoform X6 [Crassostrea virginica]